MFLLSPARIAIESGRKDAAFLQMNLGPRIDPAGHARFRSKQRRVLPAEPSFVPSAKAPAPSSSTTICGAAGAMGDVDMTARPRKPPSRDLLRSDCVKGPATVIQAVAACRHAAEAIDSFLQKGYVPEGIRITAQSRVARRLAPLAFEALPRIVVRCSPHYLPRSIFGFDEVERTIVRTGGAGGGRRCLAVRLPTAMIAHCAKRPPTTDRVCRTGSYALIFHCRRHPSSCGPQQMYCLRPLHRGLCGDRGSGILAFRSRADGRWSVPKAD
jgi:hypothetical protein